MLADAFKYTAERFQNLTSHVAGVDDTLARAIGTLLAGLSNQHVVGQDPVVLATKKAYLVLAKDVEVPVIDLGGDYYYELGNAAPERTDASPSPGTLGRRQSAGEGTPSTGEGTETGGSTDDS